MTRIDRLFSAFSSNSILFLTCAGIWGSTWLVIKYQLTDIDPVVSVFYRFFISTALLFLFALGTGKSLSYPRRYHLNFFFQGALNFSINYILTYWSEAYAPSAMIALAFTMLLPFNILGMRIFFKKPIPPTMYLGASMGMTGIFLIFYDRLVDFQTEGEILKGLGLALLSTLCASAGNMLAYRNHLRKIPVTAANSWGMFYGTVTTLILALVMQKPMQFTDSLVYWSSLFYLALFGTVLAFGAYLTLVARIGAEGAGYTTILAPVIAVSLSMIFENLHISASIGWGLIFCLMGNYVTLHGQRKIEPKLVSN